MALSFQAPIPYNLKTSIIQIDSYQDKQLKGTLQNPYYDRKMPFDNLIQLLFLIESMINDIGSPKKSMESRSFFNHPVVPCATSRNQDKEPSRTEPPLATFVISIVFRHHASWQGNIFWHEQEMESQFRSVLEMVLLMDSVLTAPFQKHTTGRSAYH
ncbi:MAG: hypothetical protein ACOX0U_04750 [Oscillospiraceae bacterium]